MERTKSITTHEFIFPGNYKGLWSAYYVNIIFHNGNKSHDIKLNNGVRGINCDCDVVVDDKGWVYVD